MPWCFVPHRAYSAKSEISAPISFMARRIGLYMDSYFRRFLICIFACCLTSQAQTPPSTALNNDIQAQVATPPAREATINRAIGLMGGNHWKSMSRVVIDATISDGSKNQLQKWTYDVSGAKIRSRVEPASSSDTMMSAFNSQAHDAKWRPIARAYDLISLLYTFPGIALDIAAERQLCRVIPPPNKSLSDETLPFDLTQRCVFPSYPYNEINITWRFDAKGMPSEVLLIENVANGRVGEPTSIRFISFQSVQGILAAKEVSVKYARSIKHIAFGAPIVAQSIPAANASVQ